jgi:topoisomerase IA-like protein
VDLIENDGKTIADASRLLGINPSTGKMILKKWR